MAEKKVYIGSMGPFVFDDAETINDPDGDFSGENQIGLRSDENVKAPEFEGVLISAIQVTSLADPSTELNPLSSSKVGGLLACYEVVAGAPDLFTLYLWDTAAGAESVPYTVDGTGGTWVAVAGKYKAGDFNLDGDLSGTHDIVDHDTSATGAELDTLTDGSTTSLHKHTESDITDLDHDDTDAVHDDDFSTNGVMLRTGAGAYDTEAGVASSTVTVITAIQAGGAGGIGFQYKDRTITITNGVVTAVGAESGWNDV
jgi:hypothetical protein